MWSANHKNLPLSWVSIFYLRFLYFWPRFYIVVLGMTFFSRHIYFFHGTSTFSIFFLNFYFLFLFGLLFPFSLWTIILFKFVFNSFSILSWSLILVSSKFFFSFKFTGHTVVEKVFKVSQCLSSLLFTSSNLLKEIQTGILRSLL